MDEFDEDVTEDQTDLSSHPCPQCGAELPDDASETMGLCSTCYESSFNFDN